MIQPVLLGPARTRRAMNLNIILGSSGTLFVTVIAPGTIMNVFFKNQLGASSASFGLLVAALSVAQGGSKVEGAQAILLALAVSWLFANLGTSGWWRWMADLIPEDIRSTFFSRRSAIINGVTMIWFLLATVALDLFKNADIFSVYCVLFAVGGLGGVREAVLYIFMPEPQAREPRPAFRWADVLKPVRDANFVRFSLSIAVWLFSANILGPFVAPFITAPDGAGAPHTWLGIMMVIS